jgi:lipopolysaccharide/colanic/teichoic acid biosynthesis glycosyltransferase
MSLVGPRPKTPNYVDSYHVPDHPEQATTKPGVTGWAQANGSSDPKTELANDLYYIKNRSLKLDLLILVRTIKRALARY